MAVLSVSIAGDQPAMIRNYISKWGSTPMKATREFQRLVRESFDIYPQIGLPTLIVQGKRVLIMENSGHMVCHNEDSPGMMKEVLQFIRSIPEDSR
jgi:esterase/lipase